MNFVENIRGKLIYILIINPTLSEWGVDHIGGVDFDDPEVNVGMMNAYFASFGCTPSNPHPCGRYA